MNINAYIDEDRVKHILVSGEVIMKDDVYKILMNIYKEDAQALSMTFLDANTLNMHIVEKLHTMQKSRPCKIYVFKMHLYSYLHKLGIKCEYLRSRHLKIKEYIKLRENINIDKDLESFLGEIYHLYGYDYTRYQQDSIKRRIKVCMVKENIHNFKEFRNLVLNDPKIFEQLFQDFSINTTGFFRDSEVFLAIKSRILPYLASYMHIKIWCVGCSNGKEAYSMAILLDELGLLHKAQIYATDINPYIIEEAKNGLYPMEDIDKDILNYKKAGGEKSFINYFHLKGNYIKVKSHLKKNILFFQHSLTEGGSLNEFELILCRNVMMYFNIDLQNSVLKNFYNSLDRNGFLVIGKSEGMMLNAGESYFEKYMTKEKIYKIR